MNISVWDVLDKRFLWVAKDPDGVWYAYSDKPIKTSSGEYTITRESGAVAEKIEVLSENVEMPLFDLSPRPASYLEPEDKCDICSKSIDLEKAYHFSGFVNGEFSRHIHCCPKCFYEYSFPLINIGV